MNSRQGDVYLYNKKVGIIEEQVSGDYLFTYLPEYLKSGDKRGVSLTLPPREGPYKSDKMFAFFDGLIPEGWLLDHAIRNWKLVNKDRMGLLLSVCADPIGATHILEKGKAYEAQPLLEGQWPSKEELVELEEQEYCLISYRALPEGEKYFHPDEIKKMFGQVDYRPVLDIGLKDIETLAQTKVSQRLSVTGVQKKLSLNIENQENSKRFTIVNFDGNFILKPPSPDYPQMPEIEHLCMLMAKIIGLPVPECALIPLGDGNLAYIVKRYDRDNGKKQYQEDFCQLMEKPTEDKYRSSLEKAKIINQHCSKRTPNLAHFFDLNLYCYLIGNSDMHLKNFSLIENNRTNELQLSPCYDLLATKLLVPEDEEQSALAINGKKNKINRQDWVALAENIGLDSRYVDNSVKKFQRSMKKFKNLIFKSKLNDEFREQLWELMQKNLSSVE